MGSIAKPPLLRITATQLVVLTALTAVILPFGLVQAYSLLAGGLVQIAGSAYFARLAFRYRGARQARLAVQAMYRGETGKLVLSAALFAIVFVFVRPLDIMAFFAGYTVMMLACFILAAHVIKTYRP